MDYIDVENDAEYGAIEPDERLMTASARVLGAQDTSDEDFEAIIARLKHELQMQQDRADAAQKMVGEHMDTI